MAKDAMGTVLLVEDDPILGKGLQLNLELDGHRVVWAKDLKSAFRENEANQFNIVILDLGLPDGNGIAFCKRLRESDSRIPIIILTAQTDENSVVNGFGFGATDYVKKPFSNRELLARVRAAIREPAIRDEQLRYGELLILPEKRQAYVNKIPITLNRREFDILMYLVRKAETVVSREKLIEVLGNESEIFDRTIDSHVSHIRSRLRAAELDTINISSVYGVGYKLEKK